MTVVHNKFNIGDKAYILTLMHTLKDMYWTVEEVIITHVIFDNNCIRYLVKATRKNILVNEIIDEINLFKTKEEAEEELIKIANWYED